MKQKIQDFLKGVGEHHVAMAKAHQTAADGYEADSVEYVFHKTPLASHTDMADACLPACKTLQTADEGEFERDFSQLAPTRINGVSPSESPRTLSRPAPQARQFRCSALFSHLSVFEHRGLQCVLPKAAKGRIS